MRTTANWSVFLIACAATVLAATAAAMPPGLNDVPFMTRAASVEPALSYGDLKVIDANGRRIPARLILGPRQLAIQVRVRDAAWPIVVDPFIVEPGEPILDWIEPGYLIGESEESVQVPVRWNRYYGKPALTARYWVDDELVLTRAVEARDIAAGDEPQSGSATLTIEGGGEYELAVSLGNTEACSESQSVRVSIIDPEAPLRTAETSDLDAGMPSYEEAKQNVLETAAWFASHPQRSPTITDPAALGRGSRFASFVGQSALGFGIDMGLVALMKMMGLGSGGPNLAAELSKIQQSLEEVRKQLNAIAARIEELAAETQFKTRIVRQLWRFKISAGLPLRSRRSRKLACWTTINSLR